MANEPQGQTAGALRLVTLAEVKSLIEREQAARAELSYEQKLALDHAQHFARLDPERSRSLVEKLQALGGRVSDYYAHRIADVLPTHADDVRAIFARDRSAPDNDEIEKILAAVREFV